MSYVLYANLRLILSPILMTVGYNFDSHFYFDWFNNNNIYSKDIIITSSVMMDVLLLKLSLGLIRMKDTCEVSWLAGITIKINYHIELVFW